MKIKMNDVQGEKLYNLGKALNNVVNDVVKKVGAENIEGIVLDLEALVHFKVKGEKEPQLLLTDREILGKREIFTIIPMVDKEGKVLSSEDNEDETFEEVGELLDKELPSKPIKSEYDSTHMRTVKETSHNGIRETIYKDGANRLVQYHIKGIGLVHEVYLTEKELVH